jgi:uncharacterized protein YaeQ
MALKATIFKVSVSIADMDRPCYGGHALTMARHPSETDERTLRKAAGRAAEVIVLVNGGKAADI